VTVGPEPGATVRAKVVAVAAHGAAIVCSHVAREGLPIMYAQRGAPIRPEDSGWQFLCNEGVEHTDAAVWSVSEVLEHEPTLLGLLEGPPGTQVVRERRERAWKVVPPR